MQAREEKMRDGRPARFALRCAAALCAAALAAALLLLLFAFPRLEFYRKRQEFSSQLPMAAAGVAALLAASLAYARLFRRAGPLRRRTLAAFCLALFCVQAFLAYFCYFIPGFDLVSILKSAYAIAGGDERIDNYYLSIYPNNAALALLFGLVLRAFRFVTGGARLDRCVYCLVLLQCAINSWTAYLTARTAQGCLGERAALPAFLLYAAFTGFSPWSLVPYSDGVTLFIPVAILRLYQLRARRCCWPLIGLLAGLGWCFKPQTAIAAIAVLAVEGARLLGERGAGPGALSFARRAGCVALLAAVCAGPVRTAALNASPIELRPGWSVGPLHYVMMGLNPQTNGVYHDDDFALSAQAPDPQTRAERQLERIRERVSAMDAKDWALHLARKALSNFSDAPVIWSYDGVALWQRVEDKDAVLSPLLKRLLAVDEDGAYTVSGLFVYFQCVYIALLCFSLAACVRALRRSTPDPAEGAAMLALFGLMLFQMIFEAGNRYLYIYTPLLVLLALRGLAGVARGRR